MPVELISPATVRVFSFRHKRTERGVITTS
jgi:hypothetical protein